MRIHSKYMRFPGGLKKAVTLSYDDGVEQDLTLIELLKKYRMRATFNVSSGWLSEEGTVYPEGETHRRMSVSQCIKGYDLSVCEVAAHADTHPWIDTLTPAMMMNEVVEDRKRLEDMFGIIIKGMAYPYGVYNDTVVDVLRLAGIRYCRTVHSTRMFDIPEDWLRLNPTCHHDDEELFHLTDTFLKEEVEQRPQMFYLWGHTFEFERNDNWNRIEEFMQKVSGREDIWYAANIEIYEYTKAYEALEFSVDGSRIYNPTAIDVYLEINGKQLMVPAGGEITN